MEDGKLVSNFGDRAFRGPGDGHLFTTREYDDFLLRFDFKIAPDANSGVLIARHARAGCPPTDGGPSLRPLFPDMARDYELTP